MFVKHQDHYTDETVDCKIDGMLFRTFAEMDLWQLSKLSTTCDQHEAVSQIKMSTILSSYEGHSIFSIFKDSITVYE